VEAIIADLRAALSRGGSLLREEDGAVLRSRLAEVADAAGEMLRALDDVTTKHALAEVRPHLIAVARASGLHLPGW
jgi:hypothetical protein